jgi:hypothetical protein
LNEEYDSEDGYDDCGIHEGDETGEEATWKVNDGIIFTSGCEGFTEELLEKMRYWVIHTSLILLEPIICSFSPKGATSYFQSWSWTLQVIVIVLSTFLHWVQADVVLRRAFRGSSGDFGHERIAKFIALFFSYSETKGVMIEFVCLLCGWVFIWWRPGIAILRCFRLLRILFYNDLPEHPKKLIKRSLTFVVGVLSFEIFEKNTKLHNH